MCERIRLIVSYVSRQRGGGGCGVARAVGMGFGLRGEVTRFGLGLSARVSVTVLEASSVFTSEVAERDRFVAWGGGSVTCGSSGMSAVTLSLFDRRTCSTASAGSYRVTLAEYGLCVARKLEDKVLFIVRT